MRENRDVDPALPADGPRLRPGGDDHLLRLDDAVGGLNGLHRAVAVGPQADEMRLLVDVRAVGAGGPEVAGDGIGGGGRSVARRVGRPDEIVGADSREHPRDMGGIEDFHLHAKGFL